MTPGFGLNGGVSLFFLGCFTRTASPVLTVDRFAPVFLLEYCLRFCFTFVSFFLINLSLHFTENWDNKVFIDQLNMMSAGASPVEGCGHAR